MKKKVAIIGSGIAGLTLANFLQKDSSLEFVLYEKENNLNLNEGFGIQLSTNSISILNKIGFNQLNLGEKFHPSKLDFYSLNLNKICDMDLTIFNSLNEKYTTLKRSTLIHFLKKKILSNLILFGKKVDKVIQKNEKINIYFSDKSVDQVDYLIISDGIFSNTKSIVEKKLFKPNYYGATAIRTQIKQQEISTFNINNISLIMGSNFHLVLYPINNQKEINLVSIIRNKSEQNYSAEALLENKVFKKNKNLVNLFKGSLKSWPVYISEKPIKSIYKNVLYIGDAFFTFPPTMAQGASQAIESANEAFNLIKNNNQDLQKIYFESREKRTNLINKRSKLNYFGFHISNPLLKIFRNKILKMLIKNKNFIKSYLGEVYKK
jgi:salicylate hydroxylase